MMMRKHNWPIQEQANFLKRTGELLARGYPISEAIESISLHLPTKQKEDLHGCLEDLKTGISFHECLDKLGFHKDLIGYVYFAEQHGSFSQALLEGSALALIKDKDLKKLFKLLQYPMLLIMITGFLFLFIKNMLLPRFTVLFHSMSLQENFFTKVIYGFDRYFPAAMYAFLIIAIGAAAYYLLVFRKLSILKQRSHLIHVPIAGSILKSLFTHYFSTQLSFLLAGGISVSEALLLFEENKRQPFYSALGKEIKAKLLTGEKLETIIGLFPFFESEFSLIVKHGQENGKLDQELLFFGQHCVSRMEEMIEKWLKVIQPAMYMLIAFLVISMYLAILLPMFHLLDGI